MPSVPTMTQDEFVNTVRAELGTQPHKPTFSHFNIGPSAAEPAAYALIVGAGFSNGVVPLVRELMHETIGDYYIPDQDMSLMERPASVRRKNSAAFWSEFNRAAAANNLAMVAVDRNGLPADPGAAYQQLFTYVGTNALFAVKDQREP